MSTNATIIPSFQAIFEHVNPEETIITELTKHNEEEQKRIFEAFRMIMQDEIVFVMTAMRMQRAIS